MPKFQLELVRTIKVWEYATVIVEADDEAAAHAMGEDIAGEGYLDDPEHEHEHGHKFECVESFEENDAGCSEIQDTACLVDRTKQLETT